METNHAAIDAAIDDLGLTYDVKFVPLSKSRNADKAASKNPSDWSLNWKITLSKGARALVTDYQQGIAHVPGYRQNRRWTIDAYDDMKWAVENGRIPNQGMPSSGMRDFRAKPIPAPLLRDVLYCLVLDAGVLDYASFEEWAADYGGNPDSRTEERIYRQCLDIGLQLRAMVGDVGLATLRNAFQNY